MDYIIFILKKKYFAIHRPHGWWRYIFFWIIYVEVFSFFSYITMDFLLLNGSRCILSSWRETHKPHDSFPIDWFWLRGWLINKGAICTRTAPLFWIFISLFQDPRTKLERNIGSQNQSIQNRARSHTHTHTNRHWHRFRHRHRHTHTGGIPNAHTHIHTHTLSLSLSLLPPLSLFLSLSLSLFLSLSHTHTNTHTHTDHNTVVMYHGRCLCCSMLQCVAVCCSALQCVAVCCSVL